MTDAKKFMKSLRPGDVISAEGFDRAIVVGRAVDYDHVGSGYKIIELYMKDEQYFTSFYSFDLVNPTLMRKGAIAQKERSDGFTFTVLSFDGKKREVVGGCRHPGNVKQALKFWNDDYRIGDGYYVDRVRLRLNRESRKLVTQLASRVDKQLEKLKAESARRVAKKKKKSR